MGRRPAPLKSAIIDKMAERQAQERIRRNEERAARKAALERGEEYKPTMGYQEYQQREHRNQGERQYLELHTPSLPKQDALDPRGLWSCHSPKSLMGPAVHILKSPIKLIPRIFAVMDIETWQFRAGVLHHGGLFEFDPSGELYKEEDLDRVTIFKSWSELKALLLEYMARLIADAEEAGTKKAVGKVWAHAGSKFDWVGLALALGITRNKELHEEIWVGGKKKNVRWVITSYSNKARITIRHGGGKGGIKLELIDSYWLAPSKLSDLSTEIVKGKLPLQFSDPIKWLASHGMEVKLPEVRQYLINAHLAPLENFRGTQISENAYQALNFWKSTIDDIRYTQSDVLVLANALISYTESFNEITDKLKPLLGKALVDQIHPLSYNTASTAGFAISQAYWYAAQLQHDGFNNYELKDSLKEQYKDLFVAACPPGDARPSLLSGDEAAVVLANGQNLQHHGLMLGEEETYIVNPVFLHKKYNQFLTRSSMGGRSEVIAAKNLPGTRAMAVDINSCFNDVAMRGVEVRIPELGNKRVNAAIGFYIEGFLQSYPTRVMKESDLAVREIVTNEFGEEVNAWVVKGRLNILKMLMFRGGDFLVKLQPSKSDFLNDHPCLPIRMQGKDLDSRNVHPRIAEPSLLAVPGALLSYYLSKPTVNDDDVVVYLCVRNRENNGWIDLSVHAPLKGIRASIRQTESGKNYVHTEGQCIMHHAEFVAKTYGMRELAKNKSEEFHRVGNTSKYLYFKSKSDTFKRILTGGGYGAYAQGNRPDLDIDLTDLVAVIKVMESLAAIDPQWDGVDQFVRRLQEDMPASVAADFALVDGAVLGWPQLFRRLQWQLKQQEELEEAIGRETDPNVRAFMDDELVVMVDRHSRVPNELFRSWAAANITSYTTYPEHQPRRFGQSNPPARQHGLLSLAEQTADQSIRSYANQITDKSNVSLALVMEAAYLCKYQLLYVDTDSVHFGVPWSADPAVAEEQFVKQAMEATGLVTFGSGLGQLKFEDKDIQEGLCLPGEAGKRLVAHHAIYLSPKVYFLMDEHYRVLACRVRSVPRANPVHQAVGQGYQYSVPGLGDRRGLQAESFRYVNLFGERSVDFGDAFDVRGKRVESLFATPRRNYIDMYSSKPFDLKIPDNMRQKIERGEKISPSAVSSSIAKEMTLDKEFAVIKGLKDAFAFYAKNSVIAGETFFRQTTKVIDEINYAKDLAMGKYDVDLEDTPLYTRSMKEEFNPFHDELPE
ncbi:hypothetical protein N7645_15025 [Pseudomonas juntendi]|uniref:hypothetical protein n=1 Tax=Pseudomonas TaxID=286 RepID=UPI0012ADE1ED|nr:MULTISPECIES: hypothetical protein [Pseudomonas]MDG9918200.1 hypothetical protein [Pseudomonas juntendi]MDH0507648.1 hypothetical protein [Pseudomonas juntendi]MDH1044870.1 hypothetical protein [Pseudomonas juntendi]MRT62317.1 hypothetical protein [Pseudomonas sp. CAH-1]